MRAAYIFVAAVYCILGMSFLLSTGLVIHEFWDTDWLGIVTAHSHMFLFFPLFGTLALAAFYLPSVVFTHMYFKHVRFGAARYIFGFAVIVAISIGVSHFLDSGELRSIWELSPRTLASDHGDPEGCDTAHTPCHRAPILQSLIMLREAGQSRPGLSKFARLCQPDILLEAPEDFDKQRYCFAGLRKLPAAACCDAQRQLKNAVAAYAAEPSMRSEEVQRAKVFLPLKVFFIVIVIVIGLLLASWRRQIDVHYHDLVPAIERGVIIGALAMLFWPFMDYAYQQVTNVLYGSWTSAPQLRLSLVIGPWFLLLLFYFLHRLGRDREMLGQIGGLLASIVAILRYQEINDWSVRLVGAGVEPWAIGLMVAITLAGYAALFWPLNSAPIADDSTRAAG
jgi:hypothetical protein